MNILQNNEESILQNRKSSINSIKMRTKLNLEPRTPKNIMRLNKSVSKLKKTKLNSNKKKIEDNTINDYLHSHKFEIQRRQSRRITVKSQKDKSFNININKSQMYYPKEKKDWASMIYYPDDKKSKNLQNKIINFGEDEKQNLKIVENSLMNKLNSMRNYIQNKSISENDNIENIFENNIINNISKTPTNKSKKSNKSIKSLNTKGNNQKVNKKFKRSCNSLFNLKGSSNYMMNNNSNNNSNLQSSNLANNNNNNKHVNFSIFNKYKSDILNNSFDKSPLEKIDKIKTEFKLTDFRKEFKKIKNSTKSVKYNYDPKERARFLTRKRLVYDSFDDETDKDDEHNSTTLLPSNYFIFFLDLLLFFSSLFCLFYIPLRMAKSKCFCNQENICNQIILYFVDILYIVDFIIGFFRAYYNFQFKIIKKSTRIILHYMKTDCIIDFLEAIPVFTYTNFLCVKKKSIIHCFRYEMSNSLLFLKLLTNIKIFKIFKVRNKKKNITLNSLFNLFVENYSIEKFIDNFFDFSFCFLAFHFFVCLNIFLSKETYPNWLLSNNSQDLAFMHNYILSCYSLIETLTTVGYGDVVCQSNIERIFQIFFLGVGVIAYSYIISSFGNLFKNESQSSIKYNNCMKILEEIRVEYPKMPYKLYNKIYNYIELRNKATKISDANILTNSLPFNLKNTLLLIMYRADIKNFKFFKNCGNSNFIIQVLSNFVPSTSKKYELLVYEGEMIEDLIIIKDGRLSLEAAIDTQDPEKSIRNYFNVNFQGITTEKKIKKLKEVQKESTSQLIQSKNVSDFDNAKTVLNNVVKKQANFLLNEGCEDISILDKTKNDNKKDDTHEKIMQYKTNDHLKNEPIKNEKGNYKYIKILDIRKNENFGGLYMFMRRPSPLSVRVRSKFAELYLLPKKEVFSLAKNYTNIWNKIHKKDFHNMLSIKHQTFNILNKYIEINGIGKITPNDVSRFVYGWEDRRKNSQDISFLKENIDRSKNYSRMLFFKKEADLLCPSPINFPKNINQMNKNLYFYNGARNIFSNKSLDIAASPQNKEQNPLTTEVDFSHLIATMANAKNKNNNINNPNDTKNNLKLDKDKELKESSNSLPSNLFINKQNTKNFSEEGKTFILHKNSEQLLPTLNNIFNENRAEKIKEEMKKSRKKENRKKIFLFGKKTAELFRNKNYSIFLVENTTNECIAIKSKNNNNFASKSLIKGNGNDNQELSNYLSLCQDNIFLDKIPEISSSEEENSLKQFDKNILSKETVTSFCLNSIYQNINIFTNFKYSNNEYFQQKTLNYLNNLINGKGKKSQSISQSSFSSESQSNSFSNYFFDTNPKKSNKEGSNTIKIFNNSPNSGFSNEHNYDNILFDNSNFKSDEKSSQNLLIENKNTFLKIIDSEKSGGKHEFKSIQPKKPSSNKNNYLNVTKKDEKLTFKKDSSNNEGSSFKNIISNSSIKPKKSIKNQNLNLNYFNSRISKKNPSLFSDSNNINNIKTVKNTLAEKNILFNLNSNRKSINSENASKVEKGDIKGEINGSLKGSKKGSIKGKLTRKSPRKKSKYKVGKSNTVKNKKSNQQPKKFKSAQKLVKISTNKDDDKIANTAAYFAKEEKEDCLII